ncbi:helix-turn-helix domain-containing protein [Christensenella hongkongensis]|uniref:helix-turn-helix domain-containing protein n=1 Tax=Christensenella hongkongensis TaxID=270498 RepID=UPI002673B18D|nr:helix-turn-helix transcriptional regulator [Christensenella hongkongensis]
METVGSRIRTLREGSGFTQKRIAETIGVVQSAINRYENNHSDAPYKVLLWYADYFDVSMDYIFCRTDQPQGKLYNYEPQALKERLSKEEDWKEFIEACFDPRSPMNAKLKEMMMGIAGGNEE